MEIFFFFGVPPKIDPYFFNGPRGHVSGKKKAYFNLLLKYFRKQTRKENKKKIIIIDQIHLL